jgi:hypothetical protein
MEDQEMKRVNVRWMAEQREKIKQKKDEGFDFEANLAFRPAAQWLVLALTEAGVAYRIYQLGLGVVRITTVTDVCPCCKAGIPVREVKR